jgi:hypothetical protein
VDPLICLSFCLVWVGSFVAVRYSVFVYNNNIFYVTGQFCGFLFFNVVHY